VIPIASPHHRAVTGRLSLEFAPGPGGTTLTQSHVAAPLKIVRPFSLDGGRALVQVLTLGPGLCGGDNFAIDVTLQPGARAIVVMQAASRILGMSDGAKATQTVNLSVAAGAQLEYYPGLTIPFADSSLSQRINVSADPDAHVGILESWAMGRHSRGEHLRFRHLSSRTIVSVEGRPIFADALEIEPEVTDAGAIGILESHRYVASGFWHGVPPNAPLATPPTSALMAFDRCTSRDDVFLRALATDGYELATTLQSAVDAINAAWGFEPIPLRRFVL
jgi:urease accessory protein